MSLRSISRTALMLTCLVMPTQIAWADSPAREAIDGVPHVRNGCTPSGGVQALHMNERWRVGGEDDEEILLGLTPKV